jgi:hypothetical protein
VDTVQLPEERILQLAGAGVGAPRGRAGNG